MHRPDKRGRCQGATCLHRVLAAAAGQAGAHGVVLLGHRARALPAGAHVCQPRLRQALCERGASCTCNPCMHPMRALRSAVALTRDYRGLNETGSQ